MNTAKPVTIARNARLSNTRTLAFKRSVTFTAVQPSLYARFIAWLFA